MKRSLSLLLMGILIIGAVMISGCTDNNAGETDTEVTGADELTAAVGTHGGEPAAGFNPITGWGV